LVIRLLDNNTINQIAAGEVIERPSSIVKELIENSIDAGSTNISIKIKNGGKEFIEIEDNGQGMSKLDLGLSIQRHATSKLDKNNLEKINTLGFRGEALPSIGAVSRIKIISKTMSDDGYKITLDYGKEKDIKKCSSNHGTTVTVENLFLKLPARYKFLKSSRSEQTSIINLLKKLAISNPDIAFRIDVDGKKYLNWANSEFSEQISFENRVIDIFGSDFFQNMTSLSYESSDITIEGYIGLPVYNRANSNLQYIIVNNRVISDRRLSGAIRSAYKDRLPKGRFPIFIIKLIIPTYALDVNVHPAKSEVRFANDRLISSSLISAINQALNKSNQKSLRVFSSFQNNSRHSSQQDLISLPQIQNEMLIENGNNSEFNELIRNDLGQYHQGQNEKNILLEENQNDNFPLGFARAQIFKNYILAQNKNGMIIVDQHAAHERIVYEKMKLSFYNNQIERQTLLIPYVHSLNQIDKEKMLSVSSDLLVFGIEIEDFGTEIIMRSVPTLIIGANLKDLINDILDCINEDFLLKEFDDRLNLILAKIACYGSIRSGRQLNIEEMNALLREIESTPDSGQCNHGRPSHIFLSQSEIEKLFERI
jgi:DNA mismatch repair protein MutL